MKTALEADSNRHFLSVSTMFEELEKDLPVEVIRKEEKQRPAGKEAVLAVLAKAADDHKVLAQLAEDPYKVLEGYDITLEQRAALACGDLQQIESWVGKLDKRLSTWVWCRLQQEKW